MNWNHQDIRLYEVIYHYCKTDVNTLKMESLSIDGKEVIYYDFLIMKLLPFQQVKIFGRLVVADKEYARNLLEISMNHLQSRSFRLRVSLKKIMQCATII